MSGAQKTNEGTATIAANGRVDRGVGRLLLPKNFRRTTPRCCLTCRYRANIGEHYVPSCLRDGDPRCDDPETHVCDGWKNSPPNAW